MNLFWLGVLIGAVVMFMTMVIIAAQAVEEKDKQIKYLREQLKEQAREQIENE